MFTPPIIIILCVVGFFTWVGIFGVVLASFDGRKWWSHLIAAIAWVGGLTFMGVAAWVGWEHGYLDWLKDFLRELDSRWLVTEKIRSLGK